MMKLRVLGCYGGNIPGHGMTSFLVNETLALDAGWVSGALSLKEQVKVKDVLISHSHLDHTCSLPFLIDNNFSAPGFALRIYAIPEVIASMRNHLFNNLTWPDFTCLPNDLTPVLKLVEIQPEQPFEVNGLVVRAVHVSHIVPTVGYVLEDKKGAIAFSGDLTPNTLEPELRKLEGEVPVYLYGFKPKHLETIRRQIKAIKRKNLKLLVQGKTYKF